ncbi:MAG: SGNH/GDSL hydrolase family protein [Janthinobacterium lividum]
MTTRFLRLFFSFSAASALGGCGSGSAEDVGASTAPAVTVVSASAPTPTPTPTPTPAATPTPTPTPTPAATPVAQVSARTIIVQAGDSIGVGYAGYAAIDHLGFDQTVSVKNVSFGGETMARAYDRRFDNEFSQYVAGKTNIVLIEVATNDLGTLGTPAADLYNSLTVPYVSSAKAAGFYVVLVTVLPRSLNWSPAQEVQRLAYNNLVRQNAAGADAIDDWAADPVIGDGVDTVNSLYYADGLHPTELGQQRLAVIDAAALTPLLRKSPR